MLLTIDIGNSHTVFGLFENSHLKQIWRLPSHPIPAAPDFRNRLESDLGKHFESGRDSTSLFNRLEAVVVASVVPPLTKIVQEALHPYPVQAYPVRVIDHTWPFSFKIKTEAPQRVGTDRLVNAEAAVRDFGFPCIIVDAGTATTICGISKNSNGEAEFLGGAIIPGLELASEALAKNTAQLFRVPLVPPPQAIGRTTEEALQSGLLFGYASMVDGMVRRFKNELGIQNLPVVGTGGISHLLKGLVEEVTHFDFNLTLRGMSYLYDSILKR